MKHTLYDIFDSKKIVKLTRHKDETLTINAKNTNTRISLRTSIALLMAKTKK